MRAYGDETRKKGRRNERRKDNDRRELFCCCFMDAVALSVFECPCYRDDEGLPAVTYDTRCPGLFAGHVCFAVLVDVRRKLLG